MSLMEPPMTVEYHRFLLMLPKSEVVPCKDTGSEGRQRWSPAETRGLRGDKGGALRRHGE